MELPLSLGKPDTAAVAGGGVPLSIEGKEEGTGGRHKILTQFGGLKMSPAVASMT